MTTQGQRLEILQVADALAREKGINREEVVDAIEQAIQKAGNAKYGLENDIRAHIDRKTGDITLMRYQEVVEELENEHMQITLTDAQKKDPAIETGQFLSEILPPVDFGRVTAQTARQVIVQRVREAEREQQYEEFKDRIGEIINGLVKRVEFGNVILDLGRSEGFLRRDNVIPRETLRVGDRVRAYIAEVQRDNHAPQVLLSRTHPQFMAKLFTQEVPEIYDGTIEIKSVARDPGSRAKIAVYAADTTLDPVGACVGMRGSRVQAVTGELYGEKVDIVPWSADPATFVVNALAPAEVSKVVVEEEENRIDVIVPDEQLSIAIGRRGQNVRLASELTGWNLDIMTESVDSERRKEVMETLSKVFVKALDVDDVIARLLITEGFSSVEEIAYIDLAELTTIEGFDEELAAELQNRAKDFLSVQEKVQTEEYQESGVTEDLARLEGLTPEMLVILGNNNIKTLDDFADLATDEVLELLGKFNFTEEEVGDLILTARSHWFEDEHKEIQPEMKIEED
ncbi:MAG: transcription termination factor NusA [Pseudomonadota bacterium]